MNGNKTETQDGEAPDTDIPVGVEHETPGIDPIEGLTEYGSQDQQDDPAVPHSGPEAEIFALTAEREELRDRLLRALAEAENARKRGERERKDAELFGGTKLSRDLLSVHDNLTRALETVDDDIREQAPAFVEGIELTRKELLSAFAKHKIEKVSPEIGEKFDPKLHQAMFEAPVPGHAAGTVIQVLTEGFVIADRLLRPAQVGVAAQAPEAPAEEDPTPEPPAS